MNVCDCVQVYSQSGSGGLGDLVADMDWGAGMIKLYDLNNKVGVWGAGMIKLSDLNNKVGVLVIETCRLFGSGVVGGSESCR